MSIPRRCLASSRSCGDEAPSPAATSRARPRSDDATTSSIETRVVRGTSWMSSPSASNTLSRVLRRRSTLPLSILERLGTAMPDARDTADCVSPVASRARRSLLARLILRSSVMEYAKLSNSISQDLTGFSPGVCGQTLAETANLVCASRTLATPADHTRSTVPSEVSPTASQAVSPPPSSRARRSASPRRRSTPSVRMRSATWRLRRGLPCR